jgi:hypothetical protein
VINIIYKKIGAYFIHLKNISLLFILLAFFIFFTNFNLYSKFIKLHTYHTKLNNLEFISKNSLEQRKKINDFIEQKTTYDKFFIDNNLENLTFLENEKKLLNKLKSHPAFLNDFRIKARLNFIDKDQNKLKFAEENVKQTTLIKETDESQLYPIEIDEYDLQKILSTIEGSLDDSNFKQKRDSPQLIIKNFMLNKKRKNVFSLDMKILKREYLKKSYE